MRIEKLQRNRRGQYSIRASLAWRICYKVIELIGTSTESCEQSARVAVDRATQSLRNLRVAEVVEQDLVVEDGKVQAFRSKLKLSFKNES